MNRGYLSPLNGWIERQVIPPLSVHLSHLLSEIMPLQVQYYSIFGLIIGLLGCIMLTDLVLWRSIFGMGALLLCALSNYVAHWLELERPIPRSKVLSWTIGTPLLLHIVLLITVAIRSSRVENSLGIPLISPLLITVLLSGSLLSYLYQEFVNKQATFVAWEVARQANRGKFYPTLAIHLSKHYPNRLSSDKMVNNRRRGTQRLYRLVLLWEYCFPWYYKLQTLLYRYAHQQALPDSFVARLPIYQSRGRFYLQRMSLFERLIVLALCLLYQGGWVYLLFECSLYLLYAMALHIYSERKYRRLYLQLQTNLRSQRSASPHESTPESL